MAVFLQQRVALGLVEVGGDHLGAHFLDGDFGDPAELFLGFRRVAEERFDFGGTEIAWGNFHDDVADFDAGGGFAVDGGDGGDFIDVLAAELDGDAGGRTRGRRSACRWR
jgi:hypothetical protein